MMAEPGAEPGAGPGACDIDETEAPGTTSTTDGGDIIYDEYGNPALVIPKGYYSETNKPPCICGRELEQMPANKAYKDGGGIGCDNCGKSCSGNVCHNYNIKYISINTQ